MLGRKLVGQCARLTPTAHLSNLLNDLTETLRYQRRSYRPYAAGR